MARSGAGAGLAAPAAAAPSLTRRRRRRRWRIWFDFYVSNRLAGQAAELPDETLGIEGAGDRHLVILLIEDDGIDLEPR